MNFTILTRNEFENFVLTNQQCSFFQSIAWGELKKKNGWNYDLVGVKENNKVIAGALLLNKKTPIGKKIFYSPRGLIVDYHDKTTLTFFIKELKKYLKKNNALFLKINPYISYQKRDTNGKIIDDTTDNLIICNLIELGFKHNGFYVNMNEKKDIEPRWISVLNIKDKTSDQLLANMRTTTRQCINNKNELKIIEANKDNLIEFKKLMQHTADRRNFIDRSLSYYEDLLTILGKENLIKILLIEINFKKVEQNLNSKLEQLLNKIKKIEGIEKKKKRLEELKSEYDSINNKFLKINASIQKYGDIKIIAGGLYILFGKEIVYLLGASYKEFMIYNSQYSLQWNLIKYGLENNYERFNFYGIDGNFSNDSPNYGLFDFKRGFGAEVVELVGEFDLVINKFYYTIYTKCYKAFRKLKNIHNKKEN